MRGRKHQAGYLGIGVRRALYGGSRAVEPSLSFDFGLGSIASTRGSSLTPPFTRATTKTIIDWEGAPRVILSGEVPFDGLRRVYNQCPTPSTSIAISGNKTITAVVGTYVFSMGAEATGTCLITFTGTAAGSSGTLTANATKRTAKTLTITADGTIIATCTVAAAADIQFEDVTGQPNQNPSEYISVGVLSSPFHGANVDGVKYFRTLNGNTVASNIVTEATGEGIPLAGIGFAHVSGAVGPNVISTPSDPSFNITSGILDIRVEVTSLDWASVASSLLVGRNDPFGEGWAFRLTGTQLLGIREWAEGFGSNVLSDPLTGLVNGKFEYFRFFADSTSADGLVAVYKGVGPTLEQAVWTLAGTPEVAATVGFFDRVEPLWLGYYDTATPSEETDEKLVIRKVYIYDDTRLAAYFNASDYVSGTIMNSGGKTWTLYNGARVTKWPVMGYKPDPAATNLVLHWTWVAVGTPTISDAALRCGAYTLDLLGDDSAVALEGYSQVITYTGDAVKAGQLLFAQGTSTSTVIRQRDTTASLDRLLCTITWSAGLPIVTMTTGTALTGSTGQAGWEPYTNGVFRLLVAGSSTTALNVNQIEVYPATDAALAVAGVGNVYIGVVMFQNATVCSPLINTTTATVTVNKDSEAVTTLGAWFNASAGSIVAKVVRGIGTGAAETIMSFSDGTANERIELSLSAAGVPTLIVVDGGVTQVTITGSAITIGAAANIGFRYSANDFALLVNGAVAGTDAAGTLPTVTRMDFGQDYAQALQLGGGERTLNYYNTGLPNAILQALTT